MQLRARLRGRRTDTGFTLIELLMSVTILGIITIPLGNLMIEYFQNTTRTTVRLNESHDAQIAAAYFAQDVASTGIRDTTSPYPLLQSVTDAASWPYPCSTAGGTQVLGLVWNEYSSAGTPTQMRVGYVTTTVGTQHQLLRLHCSNGTAAGTSTPDTSVVLAHDINAAVAPSVDCYSSTMAAVPCTGSGASVPNVVAMTLSILDPLDSGAPYAVKLTGQRRQT